MRTRRLFSHILLICLITLSLSGCGLSSVFERIHYGHPVTAYTDMEYVRPDMSELENTLAASCETIRNNESVREVLDAVYAFYDVYDSFYTNYNLANIKYCCDMTDTYWEEEYVFCMTNYSTVDAGLEELYRTAAQSPIRDMLEESYFGEGFFDVYVGETLIDDELIALLEKEAELQSKYYELSDGDIAEIYGTDEYYSTYCRPLADLFTELVKIRQEIAACAGYDSYPDFAYDFYYYRDYTPGQAESYLSEISETFYDLYCQINESDIWTTIASHCSEEDTFQYVKNTADAMGGAAEKAFSLLEKAGLYDIGYQENKYAASFEAYLWNYSEPFIFMAPHLDQTDKLTFSHEFGHFLNEYLCSGSYAGTDISEIHSQAFEYLSLCYGPENEDLARYKMTDSLCIYMEQAAYALFEQEIYLLSAEELTTENIMDVYERIGRQFGFDSLALHPMDYVEISHLFTEPMYMISYVVSNDLAMQFYQMELEEAGAGLSLYEQCLYSEDSYIIDFADQYGLQSPFSEGRLQDVYEIFESFFNDNRPLQAAVYCY